MIDECTAGGGSKALGGTSRMRSTSASDRIATVARLQSPGPGGEPSRHLALNEHDRASGRLLGLDQAHQDEAGELVRKVARGEPARR